MSRRSLIATLTAASLCAPVLLGLAWTGIIRQTGAALVALQDGPGAPVVRRRAAGSSDR